MERRQNRGTCVNGWKRDRVMRCHQLGDARRLMPAVCLHRGGFHRRLSMVFNAPRCRWRFQREKRSFENGGREIWMGAGGMNRGTRKFGVAAIYVRVDGQIFVIWTRSVEERTISFFLLLLFFLDTCPISNFFPAKIFMWGFLERIFVLYILLRWDIT